MTWLVQVIFIGFEYALNLRLSLSIVCRAVFTAQSLEPFLV